MQVVTVLKDTTKLVTEVPFPALTFCGSGLHMNDVEKKWVQDFREWRAQYKKTNTSREAVEKDMKEFMEKRFQIKSSDQPINILDILDMMMAPDVDASIAANGVRENEIACRDLTSGMNDNIGCIKSCSDERFSLTTKGNMCLYLSSEIASQPNAVTACQSMGAQLATLKQSDRGWVKWKLSSEDSAAGVPHCRVWIGLNEIKTRVPGCGRRVRPPPTEIGSTIVPIILNMSLMEMVTAYLCKTNATIGNVGVIGTVPNSLDMRAAWSQW